MIKKLRRLPGIVLIVALLPLRSGLAGDRSGTVHFSIAVNAPPESRSVKLWFPYPTSDLEQDIKDLRFNGNYSNFTISREPVSGALYLYTEWTGPRKERTLSVTFHAKSKERKKADLADRHGAVPLEVKKYIQGDFWLPSNDDAVALKRLKNGKYKLWSPSPM